MAMDNLFFKTIKGALVGLLLLFVLMPKVSAQELNCNVIINTQGADITDRRVFEDMKKSLTDFMNLRRWTNDNYLNDERIACNLVITITKVVGTGSFEATVQIQSARPIYGTNYESVLMNYIDKDWAFNYTEGQNMDFNEAAFNNNLTSLLGFYALLIVGMDADTYEKFGGKQFYGRAQNVMTNALQGGIKGWQAFEGTINRHWLLENLQNQAFGPFREGIYNYHRIGLDQMVQKKDAMPAIVLDLLNRIKALKQQKPISILINMFFEAKSEEMINIFKGATPQEKQAAYTILSELHPTKIEAYEKLVK